MTTQSTTAATDPTMPCEKYPKDYPNQVIWMGDNTVPSVPSKSITFVNNTDHTVYPFLADANNAAQCSTKDADDHYACSNYANDPTNNPGSIYDPKDAWNQDYRGYIGYTGQDGKNYLGLPAGETIVIPVPLVFWDAGRIYIASNSAHLISPPGTQFGQANPPINPYQFYWVNQDGSDTFRLYQTPEQPPTSSLKAVVMWYHAKEPVGPNNDAPAQLLEFTIRDPWQMNLNSNLDKNTLGPLINYDVSYVDTIYLPVAMEATDVLDNGTTRAFGWIGASQKEEEFQQAFQVFTASGLSNGLGLYFGLDAQGNTRGYTQYNIADSAAGIKLPSGAQALGDSPFQDKRSSYNPFNNQYLLVSGGAGGIEADLNAVPNGTTTLPVTLNSGPNGVEQQNTLQYGSQQPGTMDVTCSDPNCPGVIPEGTKLGTIDDVNWKYVTLSEATNPTHGQSCTVTFKRPVTDYVSSAIINLWYSWAEYYIDHNPVESQTYTGKITAPSPDPKRSRVLTFQNPIPVNPGAKPPLVPGMRVTGPGIPTDSDGTLCTVTAIVETQDKTAIVSVSLSEFVPEDKSGGYPSGDYQFDAPQPIAGFDHPLVQTFPLKFDEDPAPAPAIALAFAQAVYQAMSAMSTIPPDPKDAKPAPLPMRILYNVIGCNVGQIPNIGQDLSPKDGLIAGEITDKIKSVLRGVPDFTDPNWPEGKWYPRPDITTGNRQFNVYNLDPFVWFVHKKLKLSGYGFSVDDDVADVGANGATNLTIAITGLGGLPNSKQWSPDNPFGS